MKTARKIIERLIGEYTIESMSGEEVRVSNMPETDEDLNVALMQKQYFFRISSILPLYHL